MENKLGLKDNRNSFGIYKNGVLDYELLKDLTKPMFQYKLAELYNVNKEKGKPLPPNSIQIYGLMKDAIDLRNPKLLNFLRESFEKEIGSLSRVIYNISGEDKVIHNCKTIDAFSMKGKIIGRGRGLKFQL